MDERFRGKRLWIGVGALAIVFLCIMMCGLGAMGTLFTRTSVPPVPYVQPPAVEEGAVPPSPYYQGHGPFGIGRGGHTGPFGLLFGAVGFLFKLAFFGLLLLLLLGLVKRVFWGHHCWVPHRPGKPPKGEAWKHRHHVWGPWAWHGHGAPWETEAESTEEEEAAEPVDSEYTGPQE